MKEGRKEEKEGGKEDEGELSAGRTRGVTMMKVTVCV